MTEQIDDQQIGKTTFVKDEVRPLWSRAKFVIPMTCIVIDAVALLCTMIIFVAAVFNAPDLVPSVIEFSKGFVGPSMLYIAGAGGVGGVGVAAHDSFRDRKRG